MEGDYHRHAVAFQYGQDGEAQPVKDVMQMSHIGLEVGEQAVELMRRAWIMDKPSHGTDALQRTHGAYLIGFREIVIVRGGQIQRMLYTEWHYLMAVIAKQLHGVEEHSLCSGPHVVIFVYLQNLHNLITTSAGIYCLPDFVVLTFGDEPCRSSVCLLFMKKLTYIVFLLGWVCLSIRGSGQPVSVWQSADTEFALDSLMVLTHTNLREGRTVQAADNAVEVVYLVGYINDDVYQAMTSVADRSLPVMTQRLADEKSEDVENPVWDECMGMVYSYMRLYDEAVDCFLEALRLDPFNHADASSLSLLYNQLRQYSNALFYARMAIGLHAGYYPYVENMAIIMRNAGSTPQAIALLDNELVKYPDNMQALITRGMLRNSSGDLTGAAADFDAVLAMDSVQPMALLRRGITAYDQNDKTLADDCFRRVVALNLSGWGGTALANAYLGNRAAVNEYITDVQARQKRVRNYFNLAAVCDVMGDTALARRYLNLALKENGLNPDVIPHDPNLRNLRTMPGYAVGMASAQD